MIIIETWLSCNSPVRLSKCPEYLKMKFIFNDF